MTISSDDDLPEAAGADTRMSRGALAAALSPSCRDGEDRVILASAAGQGPDDAPGFTLAATPDRALVARHLSADTPHEFATPAGFFGDGDRLTVGYSWDASGKGGAFIATNLSTGTTHSEAIGAALTITPGAGDAGTWTLAEAAGGGGVTRLLVSADPGRLAPMLDGIVAGTAGDDLIDRHYLGDPEGDRIDAGDAVLPGAGPDDDHVRAGAGNDTVLSGLGRDRVFAGDGDDWVAGDGASDTIDGGDGNDTLDGGDADDTVRGGAGADTIWGDAGNDSLDGGSGDDRVSGDVGDDTITGGAGADTLLGENDRDRFAGTTAGDVIDGGEGGHDVDTLDLRDWGKAATNIIFDPANPENGIVEFLDPQGNITGSLTFRNIENIVPCFTPGTTIATPRGETAIEDLRTGDRVVTRDNGIREIRWIGRRTLDYGALGAQAHLRPILVSQGSLGHGLPERDMLVSPNHRLLVANERTMLYFEEHEVLVAAKHLIDNRAIRPVNALGVTYLHFMCDRHEVVLANGCWTESFQPGDHSLNGLGNAQRGEIFELFPELAEAMGRKAHVAARRTLKRHEAILLRD